MLLLFVTNAADNAARASEQGGVISLTALSEGGITAVEIRDFGCGMQERDARMAFEPFYKGEKTGSRGGAGLGLALCKQIADCFGAEIALETAPGKGTALKMFFKQFTIL